MLLLEYGLLLDIPVTTTSPFVSFSFTTPSFAHALRKTLTDLCADCLMSIAVTSKSLVCIQE